MDAADTDLAFHLIDAAYIAGSGNSSWAGFTGAFGKIFPELLTVLAGYDKRIRSAEVFASANVDEALVSDYLRHYHKVNIYLSKSHLWKSLPEVTFWDEILSRDEILSSEFYRDFISRQGPKYEAFAGVIFREQSRFLAISCNYEEQQRGVAQRAAKLLRVVGPHLQRAFELHRQLEGERIHKGALEASFDHVRSAVVIIDPAARIYFANRRAEDLLRGGQVIKSVNHRLSFTTKEDEEAVLAELNCLSKFATDGAPHLIPLQRPLDNPYLAFVSMLVEQSSGAAPSPRSKLLMPQRLVLFLIDPAEQPNVNESRIVSALKCSPAEARLVQSLIKGHDLRQHAGAAGITYNTARGQLQSLYAKTGANSQAALVSKCVRAFAVLR